MCWWICCFRHRREGTSLDKRARDILKCTFALVFHYVFLPSALAFEIAWSLQLATSSVKTMCFLLTGSHTVFPPANGTTVIDENAISGAELALGGLVMVCSGLTMLAYMWIRAKAKETNRRGKLVPYKVRPHSVPLAWQEMTETTDDRELREQVDAATMSAFIIGDDDDT